MKVTCILNKYHLVYATGVVGPLRGDFGGEFQSLRSNFRSGFRADLTSLPHFRALILRQGKCNVLEALVLKAVLLVLKHDLIHLCQDDHLCLLHHGPHLIDGPETRAGFRHVHLLGTYLCGMLGSW